MFRNLTEKEVLEFQQWAYDNYDAQGGKDSSIWHPVVQEEFRKIAEHRKANP